MPAAYQIVEQRAVSASFAPEQLTPIATTTADVSVTIMRLDAFVAIELIA